MRFLLFLVFFSWVGLASSKDLWSCEEASWKEEPQLENGIFTAAIKTTCTIREKKPNGIAWLSARLQKEFQRSDKYEIHRGPTEIQKNFLKGVSYDLTDKLSEDGSDIKIRQDVELLSDQLTKLEYHTVSTAIDASGTASYLRQVSFDTQVEARKDDYHLNIQNRVVVERPWFALGFLFKPMSANITEEKFEIARNRLIQYLLSESSFDK